MEESDRARVVFALRDVVHARAHRPNMVLRHACFARSRLRPVPVLTALLGLAVKHTGIVKSLYYLFNTHGLSYK